MNEADTCRKFVVPRLQAAGWDTEPHRLNEQVTFTDGRIVVAGRKARRRPGKRADYLLRYRPDMPIAVVEAKPEYTTPGEGLQQAKDYAEILGLKFAFATNGRGIVQFDYTTGLETAIETFPTPDELWSRLSKSEQLTPDQTDRLLTPYYHLSGKSPRYYQVIAINHAVQAILQGKRRILLTMATGTGKTVVAFQICWKLWSSRWNREGSYRRPRILYLSDRNILVDDPKDKIFAPFGDARWKIENGIAQKSREMYFAIYQAIARDERRPGLYKEYAPDFFDLVIVDECHRGSASDTSNWREILEYFEPAFQLGMTATPLRDDNRDTYRYFGAPIYTYSLRQGIDDGFLAPYRVHRVITTWDRHGWSGHAGPDVPRFPSGCDERDLRQQHVRSNPALVMEPCLHQRARWDDRRCRGVLCRELGGWNRLLKHSYDSISWWRDPRFFGACPRTQHHASSRHRLGGACRVQEEVQEIADIHLPKNKAESVTALFFKVTPTLGLDRPRDED